MTTRRYFLLGLGAVAAIGGGSLLLASRSHNRKLLGSQETPADESFEIQRSESEWRALLTEDQFAVLRKEGTERANSSPLLNEKREGTYHCAGCALPVYRSADKYDSKTGWPSFTRAIENAVGTKLDTSLFSTRTEVHCRRCGGHLGHIFDDGPPPSGNRHCINGLVLTFIAF